MLDRVEELDPNRKAVVALSGGVDSVTALFAMLESGRKPRCYTFYMDGDPSTDLRAATRITQDFGLEHVLVPIPTDHDEIVRNVRKVINNTCVVKKTVIECTAPWSYTGAAMKARGDDHILIGFSAGNIFCLSRRDSKVRAEIGEAAFLKAGWRDHRFTDLNFVDANVAHFCRVVHDIKMDDFFACDPIFKWFHEFTIDQIHRDENGDRFEKAPFIYAFEDYYKRGEYYRKGSSYQVNSRLRDYYEGLLWNEKYNPDNKCKAVIGIYNRIAKGEI